MLELLIANNELKRMSKESVVAQFEVLTLPERTNGSQETSDMGAGVPMET
jgi:hypothetical protein